LVFAAEFAGLDEHRGQPLVALPGPGAASFAGGLVDRGCDPGPGCEAFRGSEAGHVTAGLGDEHLRGDQPDPGDGLEQLELAGEGQHADPELGVDGGGRPLGVGQPVQQLPDDDRVVVVEVPSQCLGQVRDLATQGAVREVGHHRRVTLPSDQSSEHLP
jgi:hypothetical protein